jgi:hypothetical protein
VVGKLENETRYLGGQVSCFGSLSRELKQREQAAQRAVGDLRHFGTSNVSRKLKRLTYIAYVVNTFTSGLVAYHVKATALRHLDLVVARHLRRLMKGKAAWQPQDDHVHCLNEAELRAYWQIPKLEVELRVGRLRWLQSMVKNPWNNKQVLCAIFGQLPFEDNMFHHDGSLDFTHATWWAKQIVDDLEQLSYLD